LCCALRRRRTFSRAKPATTITAKKTQVMLFLQVRIGASHVPAKESTQRPVAAHRRLSAPARTVIERRDSYVEKAGLRGPPVNGRSRDPRYWKIRSSLVSG